MAALPYTDGKNGNGIRNVTELLAYLRLNPVAFHDFSFMNSYAMLINSSEDARASIFSLFDAADHHIAHNKFKTNGKYQCSYNDFCAMQRKIVEQSLSRVPIYAAPIGTTCGCGMPPVEFCANAMIYLDSSGPELTSCAVGQMLYLENMRTKLEVPGPCASCGKPATCFCGGCATVSYCGRECQRKHWKTHKLICKTIVPADGVRGTRLTHSTAQTDPHFMRRVELFKEKKPYWEPLP